MDQHLQSFREESSELKSEDLGLETFANRHWPFQRKGKYIFKKSCTILGDYNAVRIRYFKIIFITN